MTQEEWGWAGAVVNVEITRKGRTLYAGGGAFERFVKVTDTDAGTVVVKVEFTEGGR